MPRATGVIAAAQRPVDAVVTDTVILNYAQRSTAGVQVTGAEGRKYELALVQPARLRTDDLLQLDDGTFVEVVAAPEPLFEVRAADLPALARLAWQLGDRHVPVQVLPNRLRMQRTAEVEALLKASGARVTAIEAPFDAEGGAYDGAHDHGHHHGHHGHGHSHGHGHRHD